MLRSARLRGPDVELSFGDGRPDLTLSLFWLRDQIRAKTLCTRRRSSA